MKLEQTYFDIKDYGEKYHFYYHAETDTIVCTTLYKGQMVRGVAKCSPDDKFDPDFGKKLAYLRCKKKFARKKLKRALQAEREAFIVANRAQYNLDKACEFVSDSEMLLANSIRELEQFESNFSN